MRAFVVIVVLAASHAAPVTCAGEEIPWWKEQKIRFMWGCWGLAGADKSTRWEGRDVPREVFRDVARSGATVYSDTWYYKASHARLAKEFGVRVFAPTHLGHMTWKPGGRTWINEEGKEVERGETGEMTVRGGGVCASYYRNPEETAAHMRDGWMHVGDMFRRDADGYLYFAGRKTGMIKVAGLKVYPSEIEDALYAHPGIREAAVVRCADRTHGEVPRAVVALKEAASLDENDVRKHCEKMLARHKVPRVIEIVQELPKTPGGKVSYRQLAQDG